MRPEFHDLTIAAVDRLTPDAVEVRFDVPEDLRAAYAFKPGQYLTLRSVVGGEDIRRSYSLSCVPGQDTLRVGIREVDGGAFSTFANRDLAPGQSLQVMTPQGHFVAETGGQQSYLLVAAGSGITPMMSIAEATLTASPTAQVTLVYGNRTTSSIMFREALEFLKDRFLDRFTLIHVLSREDQDVPLLNGRIDHEKLDALMRTGAIDPKDADAIFLCGPEGMIDAARTTFESAGVDADKIRTEVFTPADGGTIKPPSRAVEEAAKDGVTVEVTLDGLRKSFQIEEAQDSVLDAAHKAGLELPFSCAGGMCCTCRCRIQEGSAEMATNYSLQPWEIEAGFTLACQARPTSKVLKLDFDAT